MESSDHPLAIESRAPLRLNQVHLWLLCSGQSIHPQSPHHADSGAPVFINIETIDL